MVRLLRRYWWSVVAGIVTLVILGFVLQPRPVAEYRLASNYAAVRISPSGRYLAAYDDSILQIYRLATMELVGRHQWEPGIRVEFDREDSLLFAKYASQQPSPEGATLQLWRWQQGDPSPKLIATKKPFPPDHPHSGHIRFNSFNGLDEKDDIFLSTCMLSANARMWLVSVTDGTSIHFELVDAKAGNTVRLDLPAVEIKNPSIGLNVAFSPDSNELITNSYMLSSNDKDGNTSRLIRWFDVQSGKMLQSKVVQLPNMLDHYDQLRLIQKDRIVGLGRKTNVLILQLQTNPGGYRSIVLDETLANPVKQPWPKPTDSLWVAVPDCISRFDDSERFLICCWQHYLQPKENSNVRRPPYIPGYYFCLRELSSGKLIHTERLPDRPRQPDDWDPEGWIFNGILTDTVLMLKLRRPEPPSWQRQYEEWRMKYAPWLLSLPARPMQLVFVEATTGKRLSELSLPFTSVAHQFHKMEQALYLIGVIKDETIIQKYAYPLRKPWLLILWWSFGVFVTLVCLQVVVGTLRRRSTTLNQH